MAAIARTGHCPRCKTPLAPPSAENEYAHCPHCSGVLVPAGEVRGELAEGAAPDAADTSDGGGSLECPGCGGALREQRLGDGNEPVHRCSSCGAAWLSGCEGAAASDAEESAARRVARYLLYSASLPERAARSAVGLAGGAARGAAGLLVPRCFQSSRTYEIVVANSLNFLTEDIGGVETNSTTESQRSEDYLARKAVGNFVDLAGLATLHVSPLWMLAIVSDVAYGSKTYLQELAGELKREGLIDERSTINHVDDVLTAIQKATSETAGLFDTPPLSVEALRETLDSTREALSSADYRNVLPEAELRAYWEEMRAISAREDVTLLGVSGALTMHALGKATTVTKGALTGVRVAGGLFNRHILGHYRDSLQAVREEGFYQMIRTSSQPYIAAVWKNFSGDRRTWTEEALTGRLFGRMFRAIRQWCRGKPQDAPPQEPARE